MTRSQKDLAELEQFMRERWMSASDLAAMLIAVCEKESVPIDGALYVGKLYHEQFIAKEAA